jgi:hypothetical protein
VVGIGSADDAGARDPPDRLPGFDRENQFGMGERRHQTLVEVQLAVSSSCRNSASMRLLMKAEKVAFSGSSGVLNS